MSRFAPLNALRAFEVAARHLSFTKAAEELHVTPAAVGHQVKVLEEYLGVQLFRRSNRSLLLTEAGQICLPYLKEGFDQLALGVDRIRSQSEQRVLRVSVAPTLAVKWLVPRMPQFTALHPKLSVRIETSMEIVDLVREGFDIGIRFVAGLSTGLKGEHLLGEEIIVACSPRLANGERPLSRVEDLRHHTLIHVEHETADRTRVTWADWLRASGHPEIDTDRGLHFTQTLVAIQAALDDQGVALLGRTSILDDLSAGRLVQPFTRGFPTDYAYYVVSPEITFNEPRVATFRAWLIKEAERTLRAVEAGTSHGRIC